MVYDSMMTVVNKARKTLGKTGEGIKVEAEITENLPPEFRNKWGMCFDYSAAHSKC